MRHASARVRDVPLASIDGLPAECDLEAERPRPAHRQGGVRVPHVADGRSRENDRDHGAFNSPDVERNLKKFSQEFGLPPCTKGNGRFSVVGQDGSTTLHDHFQVPGVSFFFGSGDTPQVFWRSASPDVISGRRDESLRQQGRLVQEGDRLVERRRRL